MNSYSPDRVINGTFGEVWVDNDYMAEATALEAKMKLDTSEVNEGVSNLPYDIGWDGK